MKTTLCCIHNSSLKSQKSLTMTAHSPCYKPIATLYYEHIPTALSDHSNIDRDGDRDGLGYFIELAIPRHTVCSDVHCRWLTSCHWQNIRCSIKNAGCTSSICIPYRRSYQPWRCKSDGADWAQSALLVYVYHRQ